MQTELGRIAALSERVEREPSPLERQVRRVAWLIALVAVARRRWRSCRSAGSRPACRCTDAFSFAIGLIVANVPEGLLPTITLALAVGVARPRAPRRARQAAERGRDARLDDRHLHRQDRHADREPDARGPRLDAARRARPRGTRSTSTRRSRPTRCSGSSAARSRPASTAELARERTGKSRGEATEIGLLEAARALGIDVAVARREHARRKLFRFDPKLRLMSTVDERDGRQPDRAREGRARGGARPLDDDRRPPTTTGRSTDADRDAGARRARALRAQGLRVLAVARRRLPDGAEPPDAPRGRRARARACSASSRCSTRRGPRSPTPSPAATRPASASSSSPATTARRRPRSPAASASRATARRVVTGERARRDERARARRAARARAAS